jgi:hypothetical protein
MAAHRQCVNAIESFIRSALVKIRTFEISPEESLLVLS